MGYFQRKRKVRICASCKQRLVMTASEMASHGTICRRTVRLGEAQGWVLPKPKPLVIRTLD